MQSEDLHNRKKTSANEGGLTIAPQYKLNEATDGSSSSELLTTESNHRDRTPRLRRHGRQYCVYSFELLDPNHSNPEYQSIVQCEGCSKLYYEIYWNLQGKCVRPSCNHANAHLVKISAPTPLKPQEKIHPILPATEISDLTTNPDGENPVTSNWWSGVKALILEVVYQLRANLTALILASLSIGLGSFAFRIWTMLAGPNSLGLEGILNAILRSAPPHPSVFLSSLVGSILAMYVFFPKILLNGQGNKSFMRRLIRFIAAVQLLVLYNIGLLVANPVDLTSLDFSVYSISELALLPYPWRSPADSDISFGSLPFELNQFILVAERMFAQVGSIVAIIVFAPLYRRNSERKNVQPLFSRIPRLLKPIAVTWSFIRYSLVVAILVLSSTWITLTTFMQRLISVSGTRISEDNLTFLQFSLFSEQYMIPYYEIISLLASLLTALAIYWPPNHKVFTSKSFTLRLVIIAGLLVYIGYLYRQTTNTTDFLQISGVAVVIIVALLPIQRAFS